MPEFQLPEFLTYDEVVEVDQALLTSQDKFLARIALYSLRVLKQIAATESTPIDAITDQQIAEWIDQDETLRQAIGLDPAFQRFFTQIVLSSLGQLRQIAAEAHVTLDTLSIPHVIAWFEQAAKQRLQG